MTDNLMALADAVFETPARRDPLKAPAMAFVAVANTGGPVQPPGCETGEEPSPGSAVVFSGAARESTGAVVAPGAGANVPARRARGEGRVDGAIGAATFTLPPTAKPPSFDDEPLPTWATSDSWTQFFEVNVCGGLDVDEVGPSHCGSYVPHRWHDLTRCGTPIF